jgi:DNA polymerase I-like protein with 3'-5' exonuclease and polymerase domains
MRVLAFDTETSIGNTIHEGTFRDPNNDIYTMIWAIHPSSVVIKHCIGGFNRIPPKELLDEISRADVIIGHNLRFDLCYIWPYIKDFILRGGVIWDTQEAEYCLTAQQHTTSSLAELQLKYLGEKEKPSRISGLYKKKIGADKIIQASRRCRRLFKLYEYYCTTDGSTPLKIFKKQYIKAKQIGMLDYIKLRMDYLLCQINMTYTGIHIDIPKCEWLYREYNIKHIEYLKQARDTLVCVWSDKRLPEFNVNSPDHKSAVLFGGFITIKNGEEYQDGFFKNGKPRYRKKDLRIEVKGFGINKKHTRPSAKAGLYSTDDKVLKSIKADTTTPKSVLEYCRLQDIAMKYKKAAKTYCQSFIDRSVDGVLYPQFNNTITPTGRLSSSNPNVQNIPSKSQFADDLMGVLIAPEGWTAVAADFSQLEKWVQAWVSGDLNLTNKLQDGVCLHCLMLANIEGLDYEYVYNKAKIEQDKEWDAKRTNIKPIGFRMDYGGMAKGTALDLGLDLEYVQSVHDADKVLFPDKYKFFEETLPSIVNNNTTYSLACNIPNSKKKGKNGCRILNNVELLPIFDKLGNVVYTNSNIRSVGYYTTEYGKKYGFLNTGRIYNNNLKVGYSMPQFKNYPNQGGGADIQAATSAAILPTLLNKPNKIKMLNEIHDSKLFYIKTEYLDIILKWLKNTIEDVPKLFKLRFGIDAPFNFPIEFKVGRNFSPAQMKKYEFK